MNFDISIAYTQMKQSKCTSKVCHKNPLFLLKYFKYDTLFY